jgi:long-chain acyl-CoA synthetase
MLEDLAQDTKFKGHIEAAIERNVNESLARYEQIKKFTLLARDFSQEEGELTPTQKLKRNVIVPKHAEVIEEMYPNA